MQIRVMFVYKSQRELFVLDTLYLEPSNELTVKVFYLRPVGDSQLTWGGKIWVLYFVVGFCSGIMIFIGLKRESTKLLRYIRGKCSNNGQPCLTGSF